MQMSLKLLKFVISRETNRFESQRRNQTRADTNHNRLKRMKTRFRRTMLKITDTLLIRYILWSMNFRQKLTTARAINVTHWTFAEFKVISSRFFLIIFKCRVWNTCQISVVRQETQSESFKSTHFSILFANLILIPKHLPLLRKI